MKNNKDDYAVYRIYLHRKDDKDLIEQIDGLNKHGRSKFFRNCLRHKPLQGPTPQQEPSLHSFSKESRPLPQFFSSEMRVD